MNASIEEGKAALLKAHAAVIKRDHPSWTFARCWQQAQSEHPDLQESFAGEEPTAATQGYRYDPEKKHTTPEGTSWNDVLALMKKYALDRVEATPHPDDEPPSKVGAIKVYGAGHPAFLTRASSTLS